MMIIKNSFFIKKNLGVGVNSFSTASILYIQSNPDDSRKEIDLNDLDQENINNEEESITSQNEEESISSQDEQLTQEDARRLDTIDEFLKQKRPEDDDRSDNDSQYSETSTTAEELVNKYKTEADLDKYFQDKHSNIHKKTEEALEANQELFKSDIHDGETYQKHISYIEDKREDKITAMKQREEIVKELLLPVEEENIYSNIESKDKKRKISLDESDLEEYIDPSKRVKKNDDDKNEILSDKKDISDISENNKKTDVNNNRKPPSDEGAAGGIADNDLRNDSSENNGSSLKVISNYIIIILSSIADILSNSSLFLG